ncbi:uncharacterized protein M6B38_251605 [Iris pallida]|uniref:Uncharacterized protein n=1 Tax=Iris pallida TaxID=29817 RepID=A0AAX6IJE0_IRIPA|nr:uncharacterized protein M6B38_251605 [Iris pallida]
MIMVHSLQATHSIDFAISNVFRMSLRHRTTRQRTGWQRHSTKQSSNSSRSLSPPTNATGTKSSVNAYGLIVPQFEQPPGIHHSSWCTGVKQSSHWRLRSPHYVSPLCIN